MIGEEDGFAIWLQVAEREVERVGLRGRVGPQFKIVMADFLQFRRVVTPIGIGYGKMDAGEQGQQEDENGAVHWSIIIKGMVGSSVAFHSMKRNVGRIIAWIPCKINEKTNKI